MVRSMSASVWAKEILPCLVGSGKWKMPSLDQEGSILFVEIHIVGLCNLQPIGRCLLHEIDDKGGSLSSDYCGEIFGRQQLL